MKEALKIILPLLGVCVIYFVITRLWVALIDTVIGFFKKLFKK